MSDAPRIPTNVIVYLLIGLALLITTVLVPATGIFELPPTQSQGTTRVGKIERLVSESTEDTQRGILTTRQFEVSVSGERRIIEQTQGSFDAQRLDLHGGDRVLVTRTEGPDGQDLYFIADYARDFPLWILLGIFVVFVLIVGRLQGFTSLIGMAASLLVIMRFVIPGIVSGHSPVTISLIGAVVILSTSLFLAHGINAKTVAAFVGTAGSLIVTVVLGALAIDLGHLSGLAEDSAATLRILTSGSINAQGLLLGAMIIGALGVLDDVAVAQASAVFELSDANRDLTTPELFSRAMNIGRDHIASTVNTLFLAYAGAALPLLLLLSLQSEPFTVLINREFIATEVIRTLVGSIGIVASVPVTTFLAAFAVKNHLLTLDGDVGHAHVH